MFKLKKLLFISLGLFGFFANAQNEYSKWYFGGYAALDFMSSPPTVLNNSAMLTNGGCSSIADSAGNLLFYTNGITVWNKQHQSMANGSTIFTLSPAGGYYPNPMIVKQPGNSNVYYIFSAVATVTVYFVANGFPIQGLFYSVVDMSLAGGMGSVTVNNAPLYTGFSPFYSSTTEQLHATKHANGVDYWIMIHEFGNTNFRAYLLSSSGVSSFSSVVSSTGLQYTNGSYGYLKFSPTGQKLCVSTKYAGVELYDFNTTTGVVSNPLTLLSNSVEPNYRGCEFSPDGTKLYAGHVIAGSTDRLIQWDLSAGSNTAILSSSVNIPSSSLNPQALQLAPDGKIYIASSGSQSLSVINNPNAAGITCNFVLGGQPISAAINATLNSSSTLGLPNMITYVTNPPCVTQTVSNPQNICIGNSYVINTHTYTSTGSYIDTIQNAFSCNGIVLVNTQLTVNPTYTVNNPKNICVGSSYTVGNNTYSIAGTYTDVLQSVSGCDSTIVTQLTVKPSYTVNNQQSICAGSSYIFNNHTYTVTGTYNDTLQTVLGCDSIIVTQLTVNNLPVINFVVFPFYSNSYLCQGELTTFHAVGANTYTWVVNGANAAVGNSMTIVPISTFSLFVTGESADGCVGSSQVVQFYVETDCFLSIKENLSNKINLSVYPNPASEILNVDISTSFNATENLSISIIDIYGREIIKNEKLEIKNGGAEINVKNLSKGIYVLRVSNQNREVLYQQKLVKE